MAKETDAEKIFQRGQSLLDDGQYVTALVEFDTALKANPDHHRARTARGRLLDRVCEKPDEALADFEFVLASDPNDYEALVGAGELFLGREQLTQAHWSFSRAARVDLQSISAQLLDGEALLKAHRLREAETVFRNVATRDPSSGKALAGLASVLIKRSGYSREIVQLFKQAIAIEDDLVSARVELGEVLLGVDRFEEAFEQFEAVVNRRMWEKAQRRRQQIGFYLRTRLSGAIALLELRRFTESLDWLAEFTVPDDPIEDEKDFFRGVLYLRGEALAGLGMYGRATAELDRIGDGHNPWEIFAAFKTADIYQRQGRFRERWASLARLSLIREDILLRNPAANLPEHDRLCAIAASYLGDFEQAITLLDNLISLDSKDHASYGYKALILREWSEFCPERASELYAGFREAALEADRLLEHQLRNIDSSTRFLAVGVLAMAGSRFDKANQNLHEALKRDPDGPVPAFYLGIAKIQLNETLEGLNLLKQAHDADRDDVDIQTHLAEAHIRAGDLDEAERHYRQILRVAPGHVEAQIGLGRTLSAIGENDQSIAFEGAIESFSRALAFADGAEREEPDRRDGSGRLTSQRRADVLYARGYARVMQAKAASAFSNAQTNELSRALRDFKAAQRIDSRHFLSGRAIDELRPLTKGRLGGRSGAWTSILLVVLASLVLILGTGNFLLAEHPRLGAAEWASVTLGCLLFLVAGSSLPDLQKLKVAGAELEKASVQIDTSPALSNVQRAVFQSIFEHFPFPRFPSVPLGIDDGGSPNPLQRERLEAKDSALKVVKSDDPEKP